MYLAHRSEDGKEQRIITHAENVASLAEGYSIDALKSPAYIAGMAHDIGKYSKVFQQRLMGKNIKYEHSVCGAIEYKKLCDMPDTSLSNRFFAPMLEYCIAGHHTGLPDGGSRYDRGDNPGTSTLYARLNRKDEYTDDRNYQAYKDEIQLELPDVNELLSLFQKLPKNNKEFIELYAFFTRYLFSCLTDADFIDTEYFFTDRKRGELKNDFSSSAKALDDKLAKFKSDTEIRKARAELQGQAYEKARNSKGISILNMPTGSGKTLCSLKIAFDRLASDKSKKRIIYVIPYTGIIEQTADTFNSIFGEYTDILQHHSNYTFEDENDDTVKSKLKLAAENWDAPFVITTSVQFFQSLYHYKGSSLRKLHNIANSIIVFDEIHLLPVDHLQTCLRAVGYITRYLNSEAIFLSATMPDFKMFFEKYLPYCEITNLIEDRSSFEKFKKCRYVDLGRTDFESIVLKASEYTSSLIIVNSRKSAREVYKLIEGTKYHLSTFMTPADRSDVIESIHRDLKSNVKITVVSTSLVEAGIDFDFETVFRQMTGLDSILQAGGRCNREGKREDGYVYIFETDDKPQKELAVKAVITKDLINHYRDISDHRCIEEYFERIFDFRSEDIDNDSIESFDGHNAINTDSIPFRSYAEKFTFINDDSVGVVVNNCNESNELIKKLGNGDFSVKRKLQRYTVPLKFHTDFKNALSLGILENRSGVYVLSNTDYYSKETGLDVNRSFDKSI